MVFPGFCKGLAISGFAMASFNAPLAASLSWRKVCQTRKRTRVHIWSYSCSYSSVYIVVSSQYSTTKLCALSLYFQFWITVFLVILFVFAVGENFFLTSAPLPSSLPSIAIFPSFHPFWWLLLLQVLHLLVHQELEAPQLSPRSKLVKRSGDAVAETIIAALWFLYIFHQSREVFSESFLGEKFWTFLCTSPFWMRFVCFLASS